MGAATVSKSIDDYALQPKKVILEMPFGSILGAAEGRIKMMGIPAEPLASLIIFWGSVENSFWAFRMKPTVYVKKIECPVLLQWGKNDPRVTKGEIDEIFENIHTAKKLVIFENSGHESLCKKEPEKWRTEVSAFLQ
jgi:pimeloyl-ACP methyl ester carboxylesterase